jgi:serine/threonine-protein kinase
MGLAPGTMVGRYQIVATLGTGGMATVYRAFHPALDRTVALKVIRPALTGEADFVERFRQEAKAVARLRHPNIVQVFDFDEADGQHFIVMEHLDGATLKDRLRELEMAGERMPLRETARIVGEVGDGLAHAHEAGILHRDVKPANILFTRDGRAVVTDFGIAKIVMGAPDLTRTGLGIGTPEYMSPEQARGKTLDPRADLYSLGVVAYQMVTGRVPFVGDTAVAVVVAHLSEPLPPPSSIDPHVGESTERTLTKVLAKDPDDRFAGTREFARALDEAIAEDERDRTAAFVRPSEEARPMPSPARARRRSTLVMALVAVAAALGVGGVAVGPRVIERLERTIERSAAPTAGAVARQPGARYAAPVVSGGMTEAVDRRPGQLETSFAAGSSFGLRLAVDGVTIVDRLETVGPRTVEHAIDNPSGRFGTAPGVTSLQYCCSNVPDRSGSYTLRVIAPDGKVLAEIPYTVR